MKKIFTTNFQPVSPVDAKKFIGNLHSDPDISLGDESLYGDPFGEFTYNFLENYLGQDPDTVTEGSMDSLDINDSGEVTGLYVLQFEDGSDMNLNFRGFVTQGDGFNMVVITEVNW